MTARYQVVVGNVGTVLDTSDRAVAIKIFHEYVEISSRGGSRASGESVALLSDDGVLLEKMADPSIREKEEEHGTGP